MLKHPYLVLRFYNKSETAKQRDWIRNGVMSYSRQAVPAQGVDATQA